MAKKKYNDMSGASVKEITAPTLPYEPPRPKKYNPPIGLIGCGGISGQHLPAYRAMGLNIVALCDLIPERAEARRKEFFPDARSIRTIKNCSSAMTLKWWIFPHTRRTGCIWFRPP